MIEPNKQNKPWKLQRILKKQSIPEPEQILKLALTYPSLMEQSLFIIAYLTGGRISEIVQKPFLFKNHYKKEIIIKRGKEVEKTAKNPYGSPIIESKEKVPINYPGITKKDLTFTVKRDKQSGAEKNILIIRMANRKNKEFTIKNVPIPIDKESAFTMVLKRYMVELEGADTPLFPFGVRKAERIINKAGYNPHFLRDIRLSHMVIVYNFNAFQLVKFAGWKNIDPAERYVRLGVSDLIKNY